MKRIKIEAPAKINLHLEVGAVRDDGFHEILSIFQAISLFDTLVFSEHGEEGSITIRGDFNCPPEKNLIYKAIMLFRENGAPSTGVLVEVDKRIPSEAGLGGGSSDAAATLKALALLLDVHPSDEKMMEMAGELGSDVPFFMKYPAAAVSGRGEFLEEIPQSPDCCGVVVKDSGVSISTAAAYRAVDEAMAEGKISQGLLAKEDMVASFTGKDPSGWAYYNSFMETYRNNIKPLEFISKLLYDSGAEFFGLSGSGSAMFGIFSDSERLAEAERLLKKRFSFAERFEFLHSIPYAHVI